MQICCPQNFGKRRHSGEMSGKSQLKADIFNLFSRHYSVIPDFNGKKINKPGWKTLAEEDVKSPGRIEKVDQMVKIYNKTTKKGG
jgi:hypothetical protein